MAVTPEVKTVLDALAALGSPAIEEQTPQEVREAYGQFERARQPRRDGVGDRPVLPWAGL